MGVDQFDYMPPPPPGAEWWACDVCGSEWLRVTGQPCDPCWTCDEARGVRVPSETYAEREAVVCFSPLLKLPSKGDAFERVARRCREHAEVPRG